MRSFLIGLSALVSTTSAIAAPVYVHGYTSKNGTYVASHYRSAPDSNPYNNWSTVGNVNPYTGQAGTKNPYGSYNSPSYSPYAQPNPKGDCLFCSPSQTRQSGTDEGSDPQ